MRPRGEHFGTVRRGAGVRALILLVGALSGMAARSVLAEAPGSSSTKHLERRLDAILSIPAPAQYRLGARVVDLESDRILYDRRAETPLIPASNMKLVVMAAALHRLGPDHRFRTILAVRGVDLVVVGGGDPIFGDERLAAARGETMTAVFERWAKGLAEAGIRQIPGNIVVDDLIFDLKFTHPAWPRDQYPSWYEAPIGGLNFNANCVQAVLTPTKPGSPARVELIPPNGLLRIRNKTRTAKENKAVINRARDSDTLVLSGPVSRAGALQAITVRDPGLYFGAVLKTALAARGIRVGGRVVRERVRLPDGSLPKDCNRVAVHHGPLADALRRCCKDSLGMVAEGLFKTLGARETGLGTWESGRVALTSFVREAGVPKDQIRIDDGSGLSRRNRLSAAAATRILQFMYAAGGETFDLFRGSLAVAGTDGTLRKRLRAAETQGRIHAKTGYINGVWTLAGYVETRADKWLAFAIYYNAVRKMPSPRKRIDRACRLLVHWPNLPPKGKAARKTGG